MEVSLLNSLLSLIFLLTASCFTFILSKKLNFPYTVMLVLVGILIIPIVKIGHFTFIRDFKLTPDMLFFIFLPILIFESAYNINYKDLLKNIAPVFALSVVGILISIVTISVLMYFILGLIGINIPLIVCILFGTIISATDTVAVLSLFKSIGAPKRFVSIFEGESLFNDGTAMAIYTVILAIIVEGNNLNFSNFLTGSGTFLLMFLGGILFGIFTGVIFSKIIAKIKNNESVEITLTMILAHLTFIMAELIKDINFFGYNIQISRVIATAVAGIVMGNYGRYKISPKVEEYMEKFWGFFAFIANSLVFILLGIMLSDIKIDLFTGFIIISGVAIIVEIISRALSVYIPINLVNYFGLTKKIPLSWQNIFAWASPRGALSVMMLIMLPQNMEIATWNLAYSVNDFLTLVTISTIIFSLFVKVPSVPFLMKKLDVNGLNRLEELELEQAKIIIFLEDIRKLERSFHRGNIRKQEFIEIKANFEIQINKTKNNIKNIIRNNKNNLIQRSISLSALGIQKKYLIELLTYNEIDENNFKYLLIRIEEKIRKLETSEDYIVSLEDNYKYNIFEKITNFFRNKTENDSFIRNRSRGITIKKAIKELREMKKVDFGYEDFYFDEIISIYENFYSSLPKTNPKDTYLVKLENDLFRKSLFKVSENTVNDLYNKGLITPKLYDVFIEKFEIGINKEVI
ncbi:MAG: sodium:proton antiporter [Candidatus Gracilibacteria bacterium]|nr:sodium:proton antiporter [Candidatus Gracilibacteria bacterium]